MSDLSKSNTFYNHFPTPEYLTLSTSGIAIKDEGINFIELHHGLFGTGLKLKSHENIPLQEGVVQSGSIYSEEKLAIALKSLSVKHRLSYTRATLPEEKAYLFTTSIQRVPEEGLKDAVAFIIEENVPVSLADSVFYFDIIGEDAKSPEIKVAVSVLPKQMVSAYTKVFESAGITPVSYDIESQAIARSVVPKGDMSSLLILNLEEKKTGLYVVEDGVVQFTTTLQYGAAGSSAHELKLEMRKIFAFWSARAKPGMPERNITKALLTGSASQDHSSVSKLMAECPVEYSWGNPWVNVASADSAPPSEIYAEVAGYASVIGLALPHPHHPYV